MKLIKSVDILFELILNKMFLKIGISEKIYSNKYHFNNFNERPG